MCKTRQFYLEPRRISYYPKCGWLTQNALSTSSTRWRNAKMVPTLTCLFESKPVSFSFVRPSTVCLIEFMLRNTLRICQRSFIYASAAGTRICDLKEWDSVVIQDEIYSLNDLDEFVNTDFNSIFHNMERKSEPQLQPTEKRERTADSVSESQSKRRKLETGALYRFIPKVNSCSTIRNTKCIHAVGNAKFFK